MSNFLSPTKFAWYTILLLISIQLIFTNNATAADLSLNSDLWTGTKILGGGETDWGGCVALDSPGNMIITGASKSDDYPMINAIQDNHLGGGYDVVVSKMDPQGDLIFSTFLGGTGDDWGLEIAVDTQENIIVVGQTSSDNFTVHNAFNDTYSGNGHDIFVTKISSDGELLFSTYLGSNGEFPSVGLTTDSQNNIIVSGHTASANFPIINPIQETINGSEDAFVSKFDPDGDLIFSTYIGGDADDDAPQVIVDSNDNIIIAGHTESSNYPVVDPYQATGQGNYDLFVTKLIAEENAYSVSYSSFLGGAMDDKLFGLNLDDDDNILLTGLTQSSDFPLINEFQSDITGFEAFIVKLSADGQDLEFSSFYGGSNVDFGYDIVSDADDNIYFTGHSASSNIPLLNPIQSIHAGGGSDKSDIILGKINSDGELLFSSYLGGSGDDFGWRMNLNAENHMIISGFSDSTDFPYADLDTPSFNLYISVLDLNSIPVQSLSDTNETGLSIITIFLGILLTNFITIPIRRRIK